MRREADLRPPSPGVAWATVLVLVVLGVISMLDRQIISLMAGPIQSELGLSDVQLGLLQGLSFAIFYSTLGIPLGYAADRFPRRLVIFAGIIVWASAATLSGFAQSYGELLLARIFIGAGEAALAPCAYSMITDLFPPWRLGRALSVYAYGSGIGGSLSTAVGGAILSAAPSLQGWPPFAGLSAWQIGFLLTGAPGLLLSLLVFAVPEPGRSGRESGAIGSWREVLGFMIGERSFFLCHFAGFSLLMILAYAMISWIPVVLMRVFGWPPAQTGYVYAVAMGCVSVTALTINGAIVDALFARGRTDAHLRVYIAAAAVLFVCGLVLFTARSPIAFLLIVAPAMWAVNIIGVAAAAVQIVTPEHMRGRVSSIFLLVLNLTGLGLGPLIVASLTNFVFRDEMKLIWSIATTLAVLAPLAGLVLWLGLKPMQRAVAAAGVKAPEPQVASASVLRPQVSGSGSDGGA